MNAPYENTPRNWEYEEKVTLRLNFDNFSESAKEEIEERVLDDFDNLLEDFCDRWKNIEDLKITFR